MHVHDQGDRHVSRRIRAEGIWEPYETALLLASLQPGDVFVDVGANIGYYPVIAAHVVGDEGAIFAFEPNAANFKLLRENLQLNHCEHIVAAFEAGLAETDGAGQLYLSDDNAGDHQIFSAGSRRRSQSIQLLNGTECLRPRLQRLDLLKVDVQGAEFAVMNGLLPLLLKLPSKPRIIIELTPLSLRQAAVTAGLTEGVVAHRALADARLTLEAFRHYVGRLMLRPPADDAPTSADAPDSTR